MIINILHHLLHEASVKLNNDISMKARHLCVLEWHEGEYKTTKILFGGKLSI